MDTTPFLDKLWKCARHEPFF